jgi:hypothetical protein
LIAIVYFSTTVKQTGKKNSATKNKKAVERTKGPKRNLIVVGMTILDIG